MTGFLVNVENLFGIFYSVLFTVVFLLMTLLAKKKFLFFYIEICNAKS